MTTKSKDRPIMAEELMIGNYLYDTNEDIIQVGINDFQRFRYPSMDGNPSKFKPIPLTEQWFKEFGFTTRIDCEGLFRGGLVYYNGYFSDMQTQPLKYVHQLQNLYFALTGQQLVRTV